MKKVFVYNSDIVFNLHTGFPKNSISATNSTIARSQEHPDPAEFFMRTMELSCNLLQQ